MLLQRPSVSMVCGVALATLGIALLAKCAAEQFTFVDVDGSTDAVAFDGNSAQCDASISGISGGADDQAVWVSASIGDDSSSCTRSSPCKTIGAALTQAQTQGLHFAYLDSSTFNETLSLGAPLNGITIQGGWQSANGWTAICDDSTTRIVAPDDAGSAAIDIGDASNITLRLLTIQSKAAGAVGESLYAVRVMDSTNVVLDNVALYAGLAGPGVQGSVGVGDSGCSPWPANGSGALGGSGTQGALAVPGSGGFVVSSGGVGATGNQGENSMGATGICADCISGCVNCGCSNSEMCGASGNPGCSGNGGGGGQGGQGGGVSVALYVSNSSVATTGGSMRAGPGGSGGSGGSGGAAGAGVRGTAGATSSCYTGTVAGTCYDNCFCYADPATTGGGLGGDAGPGGAGGLGGGGAGGSVFLWASYGGSSIVNIDPSTLAASTFAGPAGDGGGPNGVSGVQADHP